MKKMTSNNGDENTPRREAMTDRGGVDPLVHRHAQDAQVAQPPGPGTLADPADSVFLKLYADDKLIHTTTANPAARSAFTSGRKRSAKSDQPCASST